VAVSAISAKAMSAVDEYIERMDRVALCCAELKTWNPFVGSPPP
jgi:hypothetical protein